MHKHKDKTVEVIYMKQITQQINPYAYQFGDCLLLNNIWNDEHDMFMFAGKRKEVHLVSPKEIFLKAIV